MRSSRLAGVALVLLLSLGCAPHAGPPPIALRSVCATCGMEANDLRFACERSDGRDWRTYDSIECWLADPVRGPIAKAWLSDYDRQTLHRADSLWVVRGEFSSPMGGGYAAFMSRAAADSVAAATRGRVNRLAAFATGEAGATP